MRMIIVGAGVGALAVMVVCNEILGSVLMASVRSGKETNVIRRITRFDKQRQGSLEVCRFLNARRSKLLACMRCFCFECIMSIDRANPFVFPSGFVVQLGVHDMLKSGPSIMKVLIGQLPGSSSSLVRGHGVGGQETR